MNKVYLKHGAEDVHGSKLNTRIEYTLIHKGLSHSIITSGYGKKIYINNKYIKKNLGRSDLGFFCIKKNTVTWE